jgi:hypothetical protein
MATNGALTMTDPPQTVVLQPQPQPTNGALTMTDPPQTVVLQPQPQPTNGALTMTDPPQTVVLQPQPQPTNGAVPTETVLPLLPEQPATVTAPVYRNILVNVSGSQSQRVTFDACEGSNEHHYWDHHAGITQPHTTELFHLEFIGGGSISGIESDAGFEYELRRSRAPLISKPFIEPILSSVHNVGLLMTKITFEVKIACFKPGLTPFQDKWYLTVIEDSMGVRQHPRFIPASLNVRMCMYILGSV